MTKTIIYTDGGARGNPGPAAVGVVLGERQYKKYLGQATNNQAEYRAVIFALKKAKQLDLEGVELRLDSELVYKQLIGQYKVKHVNMKPLYQEALDLVSHFKEVTFRHVLRQQNKLADKLVNQALDEQS